MRKIITVINQKGGSGKTTTALNLGAALTLKGYKVLLVDTDPQGNLTTSAGLEPAKDDATLYEVLKEETSSNAAIVTAAGGYDVLPTDIRQSGAEMKLHSVPGAEMLLKEAIEAADKDYDFVLIDCPPALSIITVMGLTAANYVLIPVQSQFLALKGMSQLVENINTVKRRLNPGLKVLGVVMTMYDARKNLDNTIKEFIKEVFSDKLLQTVISNNVSLAEAPGYGKDIYQYKPDSKGAQQYEELAAEVLTILKD